MKKINIQKLIELLRRNQTKVAVFFSFVLAVAIFSLSFLRQDNEVYTQLFVTQREESKQWWNYPDAFYYQSLKKGLLEKNELGVAVAEVTNVLRTNTNYSNELGLVTIKLKTNYNKNSNIHSYKGKPLIIGEYQRIRVGSVLVQGYLINLSEEEIKYREKKYLLELELDDWEESSRGNSDTKVVGVSSERIMALRENEIILNSRENEMARLVSLDYRPAKRVAYGLNGRLSFEDPDLVEGKAVVELRTVEIDGNDYWNFVTPMQVGQRFSINFDSADLPVKILRIISVEDINDEEARN